MTKAQAASASFVSQPASRVPMVVWGIVIGLLQAASPLLFWWLDSATVYALGLILIAAIYVGFAVADGRPKVIAVECSVTFAVVVAAAAITGSPWLHGCRLGRRRLHRRRDCRRD
jgi:hypothetical protein